MKQKAPISDLVHIRLLLKTHKLTQSVVFDSFLRCSFLQELEGSIHQIKNKVAPVKFREVSEHWFSRFQFFELAFDNKGSGVTWEDMLGFGSFWHFDLSRKLVLHRLTDYSFQSAQWRKQSQSIAFQRSPRCLLQHRFWLLALFQMHGPRRVIQGVARLSPLMLLLPQVATEECAHQVSLCRPRDCRYVL
jgi:hypothetical protein